MNAIRVHKRIESETVSLPELKDFIGQTVEIIVLEQGNAAGAALETRETFFGRMPPRRPLSAQEQEEEQQRLREIAKTNPAVGAALAVAAAGGPDVDAIIAQRARG